MNEIKTTTTYTEEKIKNFLKIYYFDKLKNIRIVLNILIIIVIINFFTKYDNERTIIDTISFIFALIGLLELNTSFLPNFNYHKLKKKKDNIIGTKVSYVFKKNNFKLTTDKDEYIDYDKLKKVIETATDYYLYINSSRSLIVGKDNLTEKDTKILTNIFKEKASAYKYKKNV